jgi:hypothetical protein
MPYGATEEAEKSKAHKQKFRGVDDVIRIDKWYGINSPQEEWD